MRVLFGAHFGTITREIRRQERSISVTQDETRLSRSSRCTHNRYCTYTQTVLHIAKYASFLSKEERALVLGGNQRRLIDRAEAALSGAAGKGCGAAGTNGHAVGNGR